MGSFQSDHPYTHGFTDSDTDKAIVQLPVGQLRREQYAALGSILWNGSADAVLLHGRPRNTATFAGESRGATTAIGIHKL